MGTELKIGHYVWHMDVNSSLLNNGWRRTQTSGKTKHRVVIECWFSAYMYTSSMWEKKKSPLHLALSRSLSLSNSDLCMQAYLQMWCDLNASSKVSDLSFFFSLPLLNYQQPLKYSISPKDLIKRFIHTKGRLSPVLKMWAKMSPHLFSPFFLLLPFGPKDVMRLLKIWYCF